MVWPRNRTPPDSRAMPSGRSRLRGAEK
jgi:hypothetical protein